MAVDVEGAHAADAFAAVGVEHNGFLAFLHELLVEHVEHFEEGGAGGYVVNAIFDELTRLFGPTLTPNFEVYANCMFHVCISVWECYDL